MKKHGQCIVADDVLDRLLATFAGLLHLGIFHLSAGVGDIHRPVDHGGDAGAGPAAADGNRHVRIHRLIRLGPGLGDIDEGVGALVLDQGPRIHRGCAESKLGGHDR